MEQMEILLQFRERHGTAETSRGLLNPKGPSVAVCKVLVSRKHLSVSKRAPCSLN